MRTISLVLVVASMACYREATSPPSSRPSAPPIANRAAPPREPVASQDALAYLPADSEFVIRLDLKALRKSPLWAEYAPQIAAAAVRMAEIRDKCGIDLLETIESVTVGYRNVEATDAVLVMRGVQRDALMACNTLQRRDDDPVEVAADRGIYTMASRDGTRQLLAFADRSTMVFQSSTRDMPDSMRAMLRGGAPLRRSPDFLAAYERLSPGVALWFVMTGNGSLFQSLPADAAIRSAYGTVRVDDNVVVAMHMMVDDAGRATQTSALLDHVLQRARPMFTRLTATSEGATITVECELSPAQLRTLVAVARSVYSRRVAKPTPAPTP
ncbi:MAG TPA: hypothetical protein VGD80_39135 [Kofleriaceae bacterium]